MADVLTVRGTVRALRPLPPLEVTFDGAPGVQVLATPSIMELSWAGAEAPFLVPMLDQEDDRASVTVHVRVADGSGSYPWERTETFYALERDGHLFTGMGSFLQLEIEAIERAYFDGRMSEEEAQAATTALLQMKTVPHMPLPPIEVPALEGEQELVATLGLRPAGAEATISPFALGGCITLEGNVQWQDENGSFHPAFGLSVQIWDEDFGFDEFVDVTATDTNGNYSISVDGDDGILQGDRDVYVKILTANTAVSIEPAGAFTSPYESNSSVHDETACGTTITENFAFSNVDPNPAINLCEAGTWVAAYTRDRLNGGALLPQIVLEWPGAAGSANYDGTDINMRPGDRWDWDVLHHEYGHYIADTFNFEDNPGGPHNIGDCVANVQMSKSAGIMLAWAEGWPTYNGTLAQLWFGLAALNVPRVGDVVYADTGESNFSYSLETSDNNGVGEDNELATQRILWDFWDTASDGLDTVSTSDQTLFNVFNADDSETYSEAWTAFRATLSAAQLLPYAAVNTEHFVGPAPVNPAAGAIVSPGNAMFSWTRAVGCMSPFTGDGFTLRFFNPASSAAVLSIPVGNSVSYSLTLGQLQTLIGTSHNLLWAVEGSNSNAPATGPYLGSSQDVILNQPPVANAGTDITAECTSYTTTPVQLDGTGSSDPDGDALDYSWSAPGVAFDDPTSATPTGNFPFGTTVATLTVSDGIQSDADTVSVTVEDTTPPDITCPMDITVECTSFCGTTADDPQLAAFFASVSAVDVCDPSPVITDDRPACFALGVTAVTFTATDSEGNAANCVALVTVEDTTPPEITVTVDPTMLWPPNHKLVPIHAEVTVTDICDPNPTFVLTSITSNEPDNGVGDGNTVKDIREADFGTPDVDFLLRAERAGRGTGRIYSITYTAMDSSGNTTPATVFVTVPHSQR